MFAVFIEQSDHDAAALVVIANRIVDQICEDLVDHYRVCVRREGPLFGFEMQIDAGLEPLRHVTYRDLLNDFTKIDGPRILVQRSTTVGSGEFQELNEQTLKPVGRFLDVLE